MREDVKSFIESNIELINQGEFDELYEQAYEWLTDSAITELTRDLKGALELDLEKYAQNCAMRHFKMEVNNWLVATKLSYNELYLYSFVKLFMSTICGLDFDDFQQLVYEYLETKPYKNVDYEIDGDGHILLKKVNL